MRASVADALDVATPWLPEPLVTPRARAALEAASKGLAPAFELLVLECRLAEGDDQVDLLLGATDLLGGRSAMSSALTSPDPSGLLERQRLLLERWAAGEGDWAEVPLVWLELDLPAAAAPRGPVLGVGLSPNHFSPSSKPARYSADQRAFAGEVTAVASGRSPGAAALERLERCIASLPPGAQPTYFAPLSARESDNLRLVVEIGRADSIAWLSRIGWRDRWGQLEGLLERVGPEWGRIGVQVEIEGDELTPYVAFELYLGSRSNGIPRGRRVAERLAAAGECDREKAAAALDWIGADVASPPGLPWPLRVDRSTILKLSVRSPAQLEAKAYLGVHLSYKVL